MMFISAPACFDPQLKEYSMRMMKTAGLTIAALATVVIASAPAVARPHRHQVCKVDRFHGHSRRTCHWVG